MIERRLCSAARSRYRVTMQEPTIQTITLPDGYPAHARWWRPDNSQGAVLYFHGIQSHGGWYEASGARLAGAGFTVLMPDRRGSGLNAPPRGHFDSLQQCLEDSLFLLEKLREQSGHGSAHTVGVSWGGRQAALVAREEPTRVNSLSLVAPGFFPKVDLSTGDKFRVAMAMVNARERLFDIPLNDPTLFTQNPDRIRYVIEDQLKLQQVSANFLLTTRRSEKLIRSFPDSAYRGPIHLFLAGQDTIIENEPTRSWLRGVPSTDTRITEYPQASHTLEFEANPEPFFDDLVDWIREHNQ